MQSSFLKRAGGVKGVFKLGRRRTRESGTGQPQWKTTRRYDGSQQSRLACTTLTRAGGRGAVQID